MLIFVRRSLHPLKLTYKGRIYANNWCQIYQMIGWDETRADDSECPAVNRVRTPHPVMAPSSQSIKKSKENESHNPIEFASAQSVTEISVHLFKEK